MRALPTHEIGSLAKPNWRVKALAGKHINDEDIDDAVKWGDFLELHDETDELVRILEKRRDFSDEEKTKITLFSSLFATRLLEKAGLDFVYDGEQQRVEMYEYPVKLIDGFKFLGHVRSFDNKYYRKASCISKPKLRKMFHTEEFTMISSFARKPLKIPLTGAYTIVDWSFDEHYISSLDIGDPEFLTKRKIAREQFLADIAREIIYPNIKALVDAGARFIQIDEPAATTKSNEIDIFIRSLAESIGDLKGKAIFSVHICFSDYKLLFPTIKHLEGIIDEIHFEYANRDSIELGTSPDTRKGYSLVDAFKDYNFIVGLGTINVHTDFIEPPELVRDRILYTVDKIGDPYRIFVSPDCGLRTRTWQVSYEKLRNMVEGRNMALKTLGLE